MSVDHRPLLERKARGILIRAYLGIVGCAVLGACALAIPVARLTRER